MKIQLPIKNWLAYLLIIFTFNLTAIAINSRSKLIASLNKIFLDDQKYRRSNAVYELNIKQAKILDRNNLLKIKAIINKYGWLGEMDVGLDAHVAFFLVIQHSSLNVQKKYLPEIENAAKHGRFASSRLAMLYDRIEIADERKQIYGSQIGQDTITGKFFVYPIADLETVETKRKSVGLEPLVEYLKRWDIECIE